MGSNTAEDYCFINFYLNYNNKFYSYIFVHNVLNISTMYWVFQINVYNFKTIRLPIEDLNFETIEVQPNLHKITGQKKAAHFLQV